MVRTGILGFGVGGSAFHAPLIASLPGFELAAIATSRGEAVRARYPDARIADAAALIADPALDLIVVATPNETHVPLARAALEAGKHVVVDKPMATSAADAEALITLARHAGRLLVPFHNRRWDGDFRTVRRLIEEDVLGDVLLFEAHWDRFRPGLSQAWKEADGPGGGALADLGPHLIDQALLLFGAPDGVTGDLAVQRPGAAADDYFTVTLRYGERRVRLASSRMVAAPRPRFALHGTRGSFVKYGTDPQEAWLRAGGDPHAAGFGVDAPEHHGRLTDDKGATRERKSEVGDYRIFYTLLREAIVGGGVAPVKPEDAVAGLRIIEAVRSAAVGDSHPMCR